MNAPRLPHPFLTAAPPLLAVSEVPVGAGFSDRAEGSLPATMRAAARWSVAVRVLRGGTMTPQAFPSP
ncbi:MAG: hypothetical protein M3Q03_14535 [Chloroflexota bacterium]|nr:hypothetical protein [Chloroflexota bacterium]